MNLEWNVREVQGEIRMEFARVVSSLKVSGLMSACLIGALGVVQNGTQKKKGNQGQLFARIDRDRERTDTE